MEIDKENRRLSLGHKQLEENPWGVLENTFTVDSVHEGTITEINDKGAIIALPYGVEGFSPLKQLVKEDGSQAKVGETLPFKVTEFNKDSKRIILSHVRTYDDNKKEENENKKRRAKKEESPATPALEKTTLGDIQSLSELKEQMDAAALEKLAAKEAKKASKAAPEAPAAE